VFWLEVTWIIGCHSDKSTESRRWCRRNVVGEVALSVHCGAVSPGRGQTGLEREAVPAAWRGAGMNVDKEDAFAGTVSRS